MAQTSHKVIVLVARQVTDDLYKSKDVIADFINGKTDDLKPIKALLKKVYDQIKDY